MEERRAARVGTVSGLALLAGGTAVAAAAGGARSIFATVLLGMLAVGMGHALLDEIRRQARRRSAAGWMRHDTINAVLLASWAVAVLGTIVPATAPAPVRAVGLALSFGYAVSCAYFVVERRRTVTAIAASAPPPVTDIAQDDVAAGAAAGGERHGIRLTERATPSTTGVGNGVGSGSGTGSGSGASSTSAARSFSPGSGTADPVEAGGPVGDETGAGLHTAPPTTPTDKARSARFTRPN